MLTEDEFASLRMAATLALTLPTVRVQIASPTRVLAVVGWHVPSLSCEDTAMVPGLGEGVLLKPCAFRLATGRAWSRRREGVEVDVCGLGDASPVITVTVAPGERVLPGDIYQVRTESGGWHHVLPTLLSLEGCHAVLGLDGPPLAFHDDQITGVTLVHTRTSDPDPDRPPHLAAHLRALRGRLLAEELMADPMVVR